MAIHFGIIASFFVIIIIIKNSTTDIGYYVGLPTVINVIGYINFTI